MFGPVTGSFQNGSNEDDVPNHRGYCRPGELQSLTGGVCDGSSEAGGLSLQQLFVGPHLAGSCGRARPVPGLP